MLRHCLTLGLTRNSLQAVVAVNLCNGGDGRDWERYPQKLLTLSEEKVANPISPSFISTALKEECIFSDYAVFGGWGLGVLPSN